LVGGGEGGWELLVRRCASVASAPAHHRRATAHPHTPPLLTPGPDPPKAHCTATYRAPELFDVGAYAAIDGRVDVWSLGCTL
jgi:serine/threonine protein kinase